MPGVSGQWQGQAVAPGAKSAGWAQPTMREALSCYQHHSRQHGQHRLHRERVLHTDSALGLKNKPQLRSQFTDNRDCDPSRKPLERSASQRRRENDGRTPSQPSGAPPAVRPARAGPRRAKPAGGGEQ